MFEMYRNRLSPEDAASRARHNEFVSRGKQEDENRKRRLEAYDKRVAEDERRFKDLFASLVASAPPMPEGYVFRSERRLEAFREKIEAANQSLLEKDRVHAVDYGHLCRRYFDLEGRDRWFGYWPSWREMQRDTFSISAVVRFRSMTDMSEVDGFVNRVLHVGDCLRRAGINPRPVGMEEYAGLLAHEKGVISCDGLDMISSWKQIGLLAYEEVITWPKKHAELISLLPPTGVDRIFAWPAEYAAITLQKSNNLAGKCGV